MLTLDGRTAIVTGGASGIGAAVSTALQKEGVRVASLDLQTGGPADLGVRVRRLRRGVGGERGRRGREGPRRRALRVRERRHRGHGLGADHADGGVGPCHARSTSAARS